MLHRTQVDPGEGVCFLWPDVFQGILFQHLEKHCNWTHRVLVIEIPRNISFKALDNAIRLTPNLVHDLHQGQGVLVDSGNKLLLHRCPKLPKR